MTQAQDPLADDGAGFHTPVGSRRTFFRWVTAGIAGLIGTGSPFRSSGM